MRLSALVVASALVASACSSTDTEPDTASRTGDLLPGDLLGEMMDTGDSAYGLGLSAAPLGIGRVGYGHGGNIPGSQSRMFVEPETLDAYIALTNDDSLVANDLLVEALTTE